MSHLLFVPTTAAPDAGDDVGKQTSLTLARLSEHLRAARSSLADAVVITVYLRRAADFPAMNEAYKQAFQAAPPTRTTVVVEPHTPGALVEMTAVAVPGGADRRRDPSRVVDVVSQSVFVRDPRGRDAVFLRADSAQRQRQHRRRG